MLILPNRASLIAPRKFKLAGSKTFTTAAGSDPWVISGTGSYAGSGGGVKEGDLLFLAVLRCSTSGYSITPPSGWTQAGTTQSTNDTRRVSFAVFYSVAPAIPETSLSVNFSAANSNSWNGAMLLGFRNYDPSTPIKQTSWSKGIDTYKPNPPVLTANALGRYLYFTGSAVNSGFEAPVSSSEVENDFQTLTGNDTEAGGCLSFGWSEVTTNPGVYSSTADSSGASWGAVGVRLHALN